MGIRWTITPQHGWGNRDVGTKRALRPDEFVLGTTGLARDPLRKTTLGSPPLRLPAGSGGHAHRPPPPQRHAPGNGKHRRHPVAIGWPVRASHGLRRVRGRYQARKVQLAWRRVEARRSGCPSPTTAPPGRRAPRPVAPRRRTDRESCLLPVSVMVRSFTRPDHTDISPESGSVRLLTPALGSCSGTAAALSPRHASRPRFGSASLLVAPGATKTCRTTVQVAETGWFAVQRSSSRPFCDSHHR